MAILKFTTVPTKRLAASITSASATIKLSDIKGWNGSDLTASDFSNRLFAVLRNDQNTLMEIIELDESTIASASITVLKRGLQFDGNLTTQVTANKLTWVKNETLVELGTNVPQLLNHMVQIVGDQTLAGIKTFSELARTTAGNPVADNDLARKAYVDSVVAGSFPADRIVVAGTAGETVADGDPLYFDTTDNEWKLTDADAASTSENVLLGIAQGAGTNGNAITNGVLLKGLDDAQTGMTEGDIMYLSDTAGDISSTPGTKTVMIGIAKSATELYFSPRFSLFLTNDQKLALAGNSGTPSADNLYVTELGIQRNQEIYAADGGSNDTYVITLDPVPAGYVTGMVLNFKANTINTGAATLNVNTLGAKTIKKLNDQDLADGDIEAGQIVTVIYDGTVFQMQSQIANLKKSNRLIEAETAEVAVTSTGTETIIYQKSIPANTLSTGNAVRVRVYLTDLRSTATGDATFRLKYGSTTVATITAITDDSISTSIKGFVLEGIVAANAATNAQIAFLFGIGSTNSTGLNGLSSGNSAEGTATEDSTGALNLTVTAQWSASDSSNDVQKSFATLEILELL